ncbi:MAG: sigma-70 family RNA polymerase sigma factor [Methylococcales bacterium]|nr:sigma-70 family RNA polymerase sigma factor [Methylococcales bacterium]
MPKIYIDNAELVALISACVLKDQQAFKALYDKTSPHLYAILLRLLKRQEWAEDILQESFIQIWKNAHYYHSERGEVLAWMISIARYRAMDLKRKNDKENASNTPAVTKEPIDTLLQTELHDVLDVCLKQLDKVSRQVLLLSYYDGYTHNQLSNQLAQPLGTVKSWIRRGFHQLKNCLEYHK